MIWWERYSEGVLYSFVLFGSDMSVWAKKTKTLLRSPSSLLHSQKRTLRRERQILKRTNTHTHTHTREGEGANSPRLASSSFSYFPPLEERERRKEREREIKWDRSSADFYQRRGRKYIEKETKQGTSVLSVYHIAQRSVVRLFVCLSVCLRLSVVVVVVTCILCWIKMDRGEKTGREGRKENKNNEKKKRGVRMISPQNASSASELCDEELGGLRVVFINDVWTLLVSLFSLGKMCYSFSSLLFSSLSFFLTSSSSLSYFSSHILSQCQSTLNSFFYG